MLQNIRKIKTELFSEIETLVQDKEIGYIDAAVLYCESNNIDLEQVGNIISANGAMTSKIHDEANALNFLKK